MTVEPWIAYVGPFPFPWGAAGSRRVLGVAMSLAHAGRRVVVGSGSPRGETGPTYQADVGRGVVEHVPLGEIPSSDLMMARKFARYYLTLGRRTVAWLEAQPIPPSCVIVYGGGGLYARRIRAYGRRTGVPVVADVVEWYSPKQLRGGFFGPDHLSAKWALLREYPRFDGVIAISTFLATHYRAKDVPAVVVPPTLDTQALPSVHHLQAQEKVRILYFGSPGRKDSLWECIRAARPLGDQLDLLVAGPSEAEVRNLNAADAIPNNVRILGRVPQAEVPRVVGSADFTILAREEARHTRAGFPTKVVESLANGTPVVTNITSDLGDYLCDGREAIIARNGTAEELEKALRRALALSLQERMEMRERARECARGFDYRSHAASLDTWLSGVMGSM